jgi:hypothetical protein
MLHVSAPNKQKNMADIIYTAPHAIQGHEHVAHAGRSLLCQRFCHDRGIVHRLLQRRRV